MKFGQERGINNDSLNSACLDERMIRTIDNNRFTLLPIMIYRYHKIKKRVTAPLHLPNPPGTSTVIYVYIHLTLILTLS